ncbi:WD40 repeat-like protein [Tothia fuscella]|uniref:WD40 repeat-like protein n=1 Tax=Tothia fuscella TaxID=1048955 RepID=A0A9P4NK62_9PEZI|nr:WD40 repeat-like protein [Tothia fuscella]
MSFGTVDNSHNDIVLAVDFDYYGDRMVTASSDHKLRVWDRKGDDWALLDTWKAHEAEIVDVKWNGPFWGSTLASVGEDGRVKLFQEDPLEIPKSGRRFKVIWWQRSETNIPFMSLDFKNLPTENLLALTTRDGYIQVLEPTNSNSLSDWSPVDAKFNRYLIKSPDRSEETGFCVTFHKEEMPSFAASVESYEHKPISLAVATMKKVKVFRTDSQRRFYLAAELEGARQVIRDIAWANGSIRGKDVIATASKDGYIRIYEVQLEKAINNPDSQFATQEDEWKDLEVVPDSSAVSRTQQSQITAGLHKIKEDYAPQRSDPVVDRPREIVTLAAELTSYSGAVWRLAFSPNGDVLASTGDNGAVRSWKKSLSGQWLEYAQVDVEGDT